MKPYGVVAVVSVTVVNVLLLVLREYEGEDNAGVGSGGRRGCGECVYGWYTWVRFCLV